MKKLFSWTVLCLVGEHAVGKFRDQQREADEDDADTVCQVRPTSIYIPIENIFLDQVKCLEVDKR